jgi:hypothetical protein
MRKSVLFICIPLAVALAMTLQAGTYVDTSGEIRELLTTGGEVHPYPGEIAPGAILGDLPDADLSDADLTSIIVMGLNAFNHVNLTGINLTGADLTNARLEWVDLNNSNLPGVDLSTVTLIHADLTGANMANTSLAGGNYALVNFESADLTNADLSGAKFAMYDHPGGLIAVAGFSSADLKGANLDSVKMEQVWLNGANLTGANLSRADLTMADFTDTILTGISSGGITGGPDNLPDGWIFDRGYLVGPEARWHDWALIFQDDSILADTGEWLGRLDISNNPWFWSHVSKDWFYLPHETASDKVGWVYVPEINSLELVSYPEGNIGYSLSLKKWLYTTDSGWLFIF